MKNNILNVFNAVKSVLNNRNYLIIFIILTSLIFTFFSVLPAFLIPGNSIGFQFSIYTLDNYVLLVALSFLTSILLTMQIFTYRSVKAHKEVAAGGFSGFLGALFGTAACSSCIAALFGFLGAGTVVFLTGLQSLITGVAVIILLVSIYFVSLRVQGICKRC